MLKLRQSLFRRATPAKRTINGPMCIVCVCDFSQSLSIGLNGSALHSPQYSRTMELIIKRTTHIHRYILSVLTIVAVACGLRAQDSLKVIATAEYVAAPSSMVSFTYYPESIQSDYPIHHTASKEDSAFCRQHEQLITAVPSETNYEDYYAMACVLWDLNRLAEAEMMFLSIVNADASFYSETYLHPSDVSGDTAVKTYGYGSFTSNYKNYACRYLAKIYIEKKKFSLAYRYVKLADETYPVEYSCGTGSSMYHNEITGLYCHCYKGLSMHDSLISILLPDYYAHGTGMLIDAIRAKYTQQQIDENLTRAMDSLVFVADTMQTVIFRSANPWVNDGGWMESRYTSGTATTQMFGYTVVLLRSQMEHGEVLTREACVEQFIKSSFYTSLKSSE